MQLLSRRGVFLTVQSEELPVTISQLFLILGKGMPHKFLMCLRLLMDFRWHGP